MTARGRVHSSTDWDPMREDYNDTLYDAQYQDNEASGQSSQSYQLDHRKLYITHLPAGLSEQGLKSAFEKYGQVEQAFLSKHPTKKYALIKYETAAEARVAMMKLNRTEPLNLHVHLAHAKGGNNEGPNGTRDRGQKDNASFVSSNKNGRSSRNQEEQINGDDEPIGDALGIDHDFHLELEKIKLDKLRVQEEQLKCRHKMMLLQLQRRPSNNPTPTTIGSSRRLLPDGRVIVQERVQEADTSFTAGAGDSLNIPGLQRVSHRKCIVCGAGADLYCGRCLVTPYCSEQCQRRDWAARHNAVCHNLTRLQADKNTSPIQIDDNLNLNVGRELPSPPAPLRQPYSPASPRDLPQRDRVQPNQKDKPPAESPRGAPSVYNIKNQTRFVPPNHHPQPMRAPRANPRQQQNGARTRLDQTNDDNEDEEWGVEKKTPEPKPTPNPSPVSRSQTNHTPTPRPQTNHTPTPRPQTNPIPALLDLKIDPPKRSGSVKSETYKLKSRMGANLSMDGQKQSQVELVPAQYMIEKLSIGESFIVSVEQPNGQRGFVCLAMHTDYQDQYNMLLGDIFDGEGIIRPTPGSTFAYLDPTDEGWYRARCLSQTSCALLDAGRIASLADGSCRAIATSVKDIPEFCCVLDGNIEVGMSLKCTILTKKGDGYTVSIEADTGDSNLREGTVTRWLPEVEQTSKPPQPQTKQEKITPQPEKTETIPKTQQPAAKQNQPIADKIPPTVKPAAQSQIPTVHRPPIVNNGRYLLLHVTSLAQACVRPSDKQTTAEFDSVLQDVALYGVQNAKRLTEPPVPGQIVLSYYEEVHYRAIVKRTKASENRYKIEYIEYGDQNAGYYFGQKISIAIEKGNAASVLGTFPSTGNEEIVPLEKLYSCPDSLAPTSRPASASIVKLNADLSSELTAPAVEYVDGLKEEAELIAMTPNGENTVPSGSLVQLSLEKNKECVNKKLEQMCTPEWKKLQEVGGNVLESKVCLFTDMKTLPLPTERHFVLDVTDFSNLESGVVCGFEKGAKEADFVYGPLTQKINEYCKSELCREPYLPAVEELCLARLPPYPQWFRAVVVEHRPGASTAAVLYTDYGNVEGNVSVADLRKCMPEFAKDPALAATADIKDWPKPATQKQLLRALEYLQVNEEGRGSLLVKHCWSIDDDLTYIIEVPDLIAAINAE